MRNVREACPPNWVVLLEHKNKWYDALSTTVWVGCQSFRTFIAVLSYPIAAEQYTPRPALSGNPDLDPCNK